MDEIKKTSFGSLQPDVEDILNWHDFSGMNHSENQNN